MKALFLASKNTDIKGKLAEVAQKYGSIVKLDDDNISHFILIKPKLQIKQRETEENFTINVWGATEEDISYLKTIFGEPTRTEKQRLSPLEFAHEIIGLANIDSITKEEFIAIMELDDRKLIQYSRLLQNQLRRPNPLEVIVKASKILEKYL